MHCQDCPWSALAVVEPTDENIAKAQVLVQTRVHMMCADAKVVLSSWLPAVKEWHQRRPDYPQLHAGRVIDLPTEIRKQWDEAIAATRKKL